ncbi:ABC transporter G family member 11 [Capsicum annuum]|uniref:ABC transporter G family member 11 n=2 Tax=Capsicum annuum TaxID=4072 RepID=A0A2G2ZCU9_CAPAN|nr:ABC transporter G family member 11 [Capsicum annuum]XP_047269914.1 ABC transporter G family member 11 [Capsicum annuum]KAF3640014.1 ABC transporter G family member 11 [Capsicum annuum]KAF3672039.1 ABC transporter G family member 11 [Capsicum annuum]PHT79826.1 ABC transporter G family member 11 [Capsicum annuum]
MMEIEEANEPQGCNGMVYAHLAWKDVNVMVTLNNGDTRNVLEGLTGYAEPGTFTALMGPSGSGKSTLLDALSGRLASNAILSGKVLLNGRKAKLSFATAANVTQDDKLIGTLTVREMIYYSAQLRLPDRMPLSEKRTLVESRAQLLKWVYKIVLIRLLGIGTCAVLAEEKRGDASAFFVTQTVLSVQRGRTVIASIHQPSSEVFEQFDRLYLLSGGKTVYFGQVSEACKARYIFSTKSSLNYILKGQPGAQGMGKGQTTGIYCMQPYLVFLNSARDHHFQSSNHWSHGNNFTS